MTHARATALLAEQRAPSPADIAIATAFVDGDYRKTVCPKWFAIHRRDAIRQCAMMEMISRRDRELIAELFDAPGAGVRAEAKRRVA